MGRYLDDAKAMYNYARIELQQWQDSNDEILLRDAAEKTWGAVTLCDQRTAGIVWPPCAVGDRGSTDGASRHSATKSSTTITSNAG